MRHTGNAPVGFEWKGDKLVVVEEEAQTRRLAFELFAQIKNKAAVARRLNELGHRTRRNNEWSEMAVARVLSCSSARGLYAFNKTFIDSFGKRIEKPQDEWDFIQCPRLVSEELWNAVQTVLANDSVPAPSSGASSHAFTGILFCACGARMNVASSSAKYVCAQCGNRIPLGDLENAFLDEVTRFLQTRRDSAAEIISGDPELATQREVFQRTQQQARELEEEISKTERLYMDRRISVERFEKLHRPLDEKRRAIQRELGKIKARLTRLQSKLPGAEPPPAFDPNALRNRWPTMPVKIQREIARSFVQRIVVAKDEIEFSHKFRDPSERTAKAPHSSPPTNNELAVESGDQEPLYIRLPKPGQRCARTGMTRSALNELILPTERNSFQPPVESKCLRKHAEGKGTRLIVWRSLKEYLARQS